MNYYALSNIIGIKVDDSYPWLDTLILNSGIAQIGEEIYSECEYRIFIEKRELNFENTRFIGDATYIGDKTYIDEEYGVKLIRISDKELVLRVEQECNEWLMIAIQLMLLQAGKTFIHAASLEKDGEVLLLPSWGGVGKTATVMKFINEQGWKLVGDDLVIADENQIYAFLKPFVIYPYHRNLFPALFRNGSTHIVKNLSLSNAMSKAIPAVKRLVRPFPRLLAFMRKYNPQSMRVSPYDLFEKSQLSEGGVPKEVFWLERSISDDARMVSLNAEELASKAVSVTSAEVFAEKLDSVFHLCGSGIFSYDETFGKMHNIMLTLFNRASCGLIEIPVAVPIDKVGGLIYDKLVQYEKEK